MEYFPPLLFLLLAILSFNGSLILSRPWMKRTVFAIGALEVAMIPVYLIAIRYA